MVETREVVDHTEINRLTLILSERDREILMLKNRPREKEIIVETHEVVDHYEIDRLTRLLRTKE